MKWVSVFMDVEDPINPWADDAAKDFAQLFSEAGVRGSFCLTGEKCRTLVARGRTDVLAALSGHALGLHTDTHSFHPSTMELLADVDWEEGCRLAYAAESRGFESFVTAFGRAPTFWGGGGNTWSPEITDALGRLGVGAYVYALTSFPDFAVHRFSGKLALPQAMSIGEPDWQDDARAEQRSSGVLDAIDVFPQPWVGVFVGHPTRMRHVDYWDRGYYGGVTPVEPVYTDPVADDIYERGKANLYRFLGELAKRHRIVGIDEILELPWRFRRPTASESAYFVERTAANLRSALGWPIHRPGLSAENIIAKTLVLASTAEVAGLG